MTKKEFENFQDSRADRHDIHEAYMDYVNQYKKAQEQDFYHDHRTDPWFIERYDPSEIYKWKLVQHDHSKLLGEQYIKDVLDNIKDYAEIKLEQDPTFDYIQNQDASGKESNIHKAPLFSFDTDTLTLYLKFIPLEVKRDDLMNILKQNLEGFVYLSMSEPMRH